MWEVQQEVPLPKMDTYIYTHNANYKLAKVSMVIFLDERERKAAFPKQIHIFPTEKDHHCS